MSARPVLFLAALAAVLGGVWLVASAVDGNRPVADRPAEPPSSRGAAPSVAEPKISASAPVEPVRPAERDGPALVLPHGERVAPLNGVRETRVLKWPNDRPFSPIVGVQTEVSGKQWYVHEDGSRSTTQMVWRSDLGRDAAVSIVAHPVSVAPMKSAADEEGEARSSTRGR